MSGRDVFVDSSAWYALIDRSDSNHVAAVQRFGHLIESGGTMVSTVHVIGETYTLLRRRLGSRIALAFLDRGRDDPSLRRVPVPDDWIEEAERLLAQFDDQEFSYVDATSFVTMRRLGIHEALAFDRDFQIAGFAPFVEA